LTDLIRDLAERKVHELSYQSLTELDKYLSEHFKFSLFHNNEQRSHAVRLVDIRNLIVHNRGIVNKLYKKRQPMSTEQIGDRLRYVGSSALEELIFLIDWIADLDIRFYEKFGLPVQVRVPRPRIESVPVHQ
jgi:hypothetical protein